MTPGKYALALYRGDTYRWRFTMWADTGKTQPADLTGASAKAEIRDTAGGKLLADIACTITDPNFVDAVLTADQSKTLPSKGQWDLQLTMASGDVHTVLAGAVTLTGDVTDSGATP